MLTVEGTFKEIVNVLPNVVTDNSNKINYTFGTELQILNYLKQKKEEQKTPYPLIIIETPIEVTEVLDTLEVSNLTIIIATLTKSSLSNVERLNTTFEQVIFVVKEYLITALKKSGKTELTNNEIKQTLYFNYEEAEHTATDVWDAIKLKIDLRIKNKCLQKINFN